MPKLFKINIIIIISTLCVLSELYSQQTDIELIKQTIFFDNKFEKRKIKFMLPKSRNPVIRYNPVSLSVGSMFYLYQKLISVQLSTNCMYNPSCSEFGIIAIKQYGLIKGVPLAADRLMRCNKLGALDVHPLKIDRHNHKVVEDIRTFKIK